MDIDGMGACRDGLVVIKTLRPWEKFIFTAIGWHMGVMRQHFSMRPLLYLVGVMAVPLGAAFLPTWMVWPGGQKIPERFIAGGGRFDSQDQPC